MPSSLPPPSFLHRLRTWLSAKGGLRLELLKYLAGIAAATALLAALLLLALHRAFFDANETHGLNAWAICKLALYLLAGAGSIGGLFFCLLNALRIYSDYLQSVEKAEARSRFVIEACPDAILMVDSQGNIESFNPSTEAIFGFNRTQLLGAKISKLIPQRHFLLDVAAMGRENFMAFAERQNSVRFPVEIAVSEAQHDGMRHFIVLVHDASERRYSDESVHHISLSVSSATGVEYVRNLTQQLSVALQNDYAFILETDADAQTGVCSLTMAEHGRLRSKNNYRLEGSAFAAALGAGFTAIPQRVREQYPGDSLLQSLEAEALIAVPLVDHREKVVGLIGVIGCSPATQVGTVRQTLQIFAARAAAEIERKQEVEGLASEKNRLAGDMTVIRDTAARERLRYEEDIAAEQELLAVTLRSIREGCITTDNDGHVVMLNPVAEHLTGWTQPEAADRPLAEVLRLITQHGDRPLDVSTLTEKVGSVDSPTMVVSQDGAKRMVEATAAPICTRKGLKLGTVLVLRDVTERQLIEEERQKAERLESIGLAAGGIAHDFNNLLTAVIGNLSLSLLEAQGRVRDRIEASKNAALRAEDLARQLLTFAKGGAPVKKTASLRKLLLETVGFSLSGTNARPCFTLPEELWPADIDTGQISQVIGNLAINAVQAMANGGTLYVEGENLLVDEENTPPTLHPGRYVRITVRDEGHGIPEEIQKKIFDPYFTTKPKGNGLGLATSYTIVRNHQGLLSVKSPAGEGASFYIYLPASDKEIEPEVVRPSTGVKRRGKILVLDDEEVICELVDCTLTPLGYTVVQTFDALTMLRLYEEAYKEGHPFDLVMMDLTIPGGMGGKEAIHELKKIDPAAKAIVSSGYGMDPIMSRCQDYGFAGSISKPFDLTQLEQTIQDALSS